MTRDEDTRPERRDETGAPPVDGSDGRGADDGGVVEVPDAVRREVDELLSDDATTGVVVLPSSDPTPVTGVPGPVPGGADTESLLGSISESNSESNSEVILIDGVGADSLAADVAPTGAPGPAATGSRSHDASAVGADVIVIEERGGDIEIVDAGSLDRVVIIDDDKPHPRFEERRQRNERRERLKKLRWVRLGAGVSAAVVVVLAVLASPLFAVRSVSIEGAVYASSETLDQVADFLRGESVFSLDRERAEAIVGKDPWVAEVRVTANFPSSALVEIRERQPVVWYVGADNKARVVDLDGFVVAVLDGWPTQYLSVTGVGPNLAAGDRADDEYRAVAQLVSALPEELSSKVRESSLSAGGEINLVLRSGTVVRFGRPVDLQNKLVSVVVLLRRLDPANLASIDVSTGEASYQTR